MENIKTYGVNVNRVKLSLTSTVVFLGMLLCSVISIIVSFAALGHKGYRLMFLLPSTFIFLLIIASRRINDIPSNIGITLVLGVEFVRLVIIPILFVVGDYPATISYQAETNNLYGIMLQIYEAFWVGYALYKRPNSKWVYTVKEFDDTKAARKFAGIIVLAVVATAVVCVIAPEILLNYRLITMATDKEFTNLEQSFVVNAYATSTYKKFFLVLANYILKPMRLIIPAFLMQVVYRLNKNSSWTRPISILLVFSPFILVDGTVARSLYFSIVLLFFYTKLYGLNKKKLGIAIGAALIFIIVYWVIRYKYGMASVSYASYFGEKINDYFCGFNIVGAVASLPNDISLKLKYFIQDYLRCVPFANTIFRLDSNDTVRTFFNEYTNSPNGQIPATLAMGCYYFSPMFAPLYSYLFVRAAVNFGNIAKKVDNPYYVMIWAISALYFALGIGVNDVSVTLGNFVQVILPIFLMIKWAYPYQKGELNT